VAGTPGIDADLSCAAGRRRDGYSMVIERSAVSLQDGLSPIKQSRSSLAHDLDARAVIALDEAREMPSGDERTEAVKQSNRPSKCRRASRMALRQARRAGRMTAALA
jgi:hypothetical protein